MRFPIVMQHDSTDCGPAVLAMIAAFHRRPASIARIRELAGTDRQGTTLAGLMAAAERLGFSARGVRAAVPAFRETPLPAVAHWREDNRNHFVVVYRIQGGNVQIADPAKGKRKLSQEEFHRHWTGVLLLLTPAADVKDAVAAPGSFGRLCRLLLPHRRLFLDVLLAAVLMTILGLASSFFIQALVDFVFVLGRKPALNWLALGMLLVLLARTAFMALRTCLLAYLSQSIDADTVLGYHRHLLGLPLAFFASRRTGEILSRLNDAIKIRVAVSSTTLSLIVDTMLLAMTAGVMLAMNWRATVGPLCLVPLVGAVAWLLGRPMKNHQRAAMEKGAEIEAQMVETMIAMQTVKALRAEGLVRNRMELRFAEMLAAGFRSQMLAVYGSVFTTAASGLAALGLLWLGGRDVLAGSMSVGELMALNAMLGMFLGPLERLSGAWQSIQDALVAAERLGEVLDLDGEARGQRESAMDRTVKGAVAFEGVCFRYGGRQPVLENLSLEIEPGECVGIVGESGSGKTTVVNLLGRFYEPSAGSIRIDDIDIRDYSFECLRREIAFVPQDIVLFNASIAENIRLGRPAATPAELYAAARAACVDTIAPLDTVVGERGLSLSGGERQRVALARAILQDPSVLVLDEPTSHLDAASAAAVERLLDLRRSRRTTIVISHRPLHFDRIIDLDERKRRTYSMPGRDL